MTTTEVEAFQRILGDRQKELGIGNREALAVQASPDEMDRIQHFSEREYAMNHLERNSRRLREVQAALRRIDDGSFGVCVDCERSINLKRLAAVPWSSTCIACQEAAETAHADSRVEIEAGDEVAA